MKTLSDYQNIYFLGIGGIGMSAIARYFHSMGKNVAGYDKTPSPLTAELESEGLKIHFEDENIPEIFLAKEKTAVIYTPAIPKELKELNYFIDHGFQVMKRSEALAALTIGKKTIAVAGTHGKTSTCAIISHILKTADVPFYAFLGGIASNYNTNFIAPEKGRADLIVVEADEFDRSFHRLKPDTAIITAVESDHLDIYGSLANLLEAYKEFAGKVNEGGKLFVHDDLVDMHFAVPAGGSLFTYGAFEKGNFKAFNVRIEEGMYCFDVDLNGLELKGLKLGTPGLHNIENSLAAMSAVLDLVPDSKVFYEALASFRGVKRRFEVILREDGITFIDDYAHHPTEIRTTIHTVRNLYPNKKILGVFQPHLFSRTRDLAAEFAQSLSLLDELLLMPIYPAREKPVPGVGSELILDLVFSPAKRIADREKVLEEISRSDAEVFLTIGAGDIDRLVIPIRDILMNKIKGRQ